MPDDDDAPSKSDLSQRRVESPPSVCEICGSTDLREIKCKVICGNCRTILKSCADL